MHFNRHFDLEGKHAFLSASKSSWVNYDEEKLADSFRTAMAAAHGTRLHEVAKELILLREKLADVQKTLNMYVNDCIGFRMDPEVVLKATDNCYGTADAIRWNEQNNTLYVFDLKTGVTPAPFRQLLVYVAMFCMEYDVDPLSINVELRIYQNDEIKVCASDEDEALLPEVMRIIDTIQTFDPIIEAIKLERIR